MKKIILMCPNYAGYGDKIVSLIEKNLNYKVLYISHSPISYVYKNVFEKLYNNFILKPFFKKNLKKKKEKEELYKKIQEFGDVDGILAIRPDFYSHELMEYLAEKNVPMILHFWDSIKYKPKQKDYMKYFKYFSTFDKDEAEEYGLKFLPNFYMEDEIGKKNDIEYDAFTVMSYDERFEELEKLAKKLHEKNINYYFVVVTQKKVESEYIKIQKESIPLKKVYEFVSKSKCIVEIGHNDLESLQGGLSFRAIDALGNKKKLITTYKMIREYDFYSEENILILDSDIKISKEFFETDYKDIKEEVYKKYSSEAWVKKILEDIR